ncbi:hypothetical protein JL722_13569 [Aureococcus anophagefferens]|nr:hypothetical protein JL722_13569 [Aureococcus anophagefferens]
MLAATVAAVTHKRVADAPAGLASVVLGASSSSGGGPTTTSPRTRASRGSRPRCAAACSGGPRPTCSRRFAGKRELVVRVELSAPQKALYRAVLTKNYDALAAEDRGRGGGAPPNLQNVVIQLRKVCDHCELMYDHFPDMTKMLDVLGEYCALRQFAYERLDGDTAARDRARRIDRFNAAAADRAFLFLLSTRAGGLGVNLATANTVVIYDADWNPHNDLQALARAHRLGQTDRVLVYRLVCRATVEERILEVAKRKLLLEHVVVERGGARGGQSRDDLNDVLRYGAEELFAAGDGDGAGAPPRRPRRGLATRDGASAAAPVAGLHGPGGDVDDGDGGGGDDDDDDDDDVDFGARRPARPRTSGCWPRSRGRWSSSGCPARGDFETVHARFALGARDAPDAAATRASAAPSRSSAARAARRRQPPG